MITLIGRKMYLICDINILSIDWIYPISLITVTNCKIVLLKPAVPYLKYGQKIFQF
jgi:hypothetical protein